MQNGRKNTSKSHAAQSANHFDVGRALAECIERIVAEMPEHERRQRLADGFVAEVTEMFLSFDAIEAAYRAGTLKDTCAAPAGVRE